MAGDRLPRKVMDAKKLASLLRGGPGGPLVIDSRSFVEYNSCHVLSSVNICCSKLVKRRLQQGKVTIAELIQPATRSQVDATEPQDVVVYDQSTRDASVLAADSFLSILLSKLDGCFNSVAILTGGFATFSSCFPGLCEGKPATLPSMSLSQPCLPVPSVGLTRILPHLYLGSQKDVLNKDLMTQNGISYVLNASNSCPKPDFICESRFMRIPINDNYCEKLLPWLDKSIEFIDKAKLSSCQVIVHCLAGISRSATIAIAYIMKTMGMSSDDAYRFVKDRRPSISPNFNFLGQLLEYERSLKLLAALQSDGPHLGTPEPLMGPAAGIPLPRLPPSTSERAATGSEAAAAAKEGSPSAGGDALIPSTAPATSALQQGLRGLHLSSDRLQDTNRLKRSFSLDIKSAYAPSRRPDFPGPPDPGEAPKLCKLDSPSGGTLGLPSPSPDSPDSAPEGRPRPRRRRPPASSPARSPAHGLGLNFGDTARQTPRHGLSALSAPGLPGPGQPAGPGGWVPPLDSPGTPSPDGPWCFSPEGAQGPGAVFSAFGRASAGAPGPGGGSSSDLRRREVRAEPRDLRTGWPEEPASDTQFKRRSCQMEFEEGMVEGRARGEELAALGKQASFSGSVEVIEVS
ncbi:dual specificity protein phosphatase 8 [Peromyscus californicus insignis]|uniref:dual specificity protein phosphatase 8 n=1 Tax=Peromyscus californicus insignis TaxID=564181 RepID=UPI0022A7EB5E|nr:dual specificity protein phosphatase 8 [Peromyscus californicus insignis]XP_052618388.1 dual specificity protein phosphatase 8 [Peromyscus californicus insignis]XP_052618389.1 dual specificity protein phosphatase 8 [Peromyscus californicus insignis]XP_052618390.1 dual specificity protein phosphatase 8 [Peromyscus californicus insignis]